jgi:hypothetical protein
MTFVFRNELPLGCSETKYVAADDIFCQSNGVISRGRKDSANQTLMVRIRQNAASKKAARRRSLSVFKNIF